MPANQDICFWVPLGFDQSEALLLGTSETAGNVSLIKTCGPFSSFEHQSSKLNRKFVPCFLRAKSRAKNVVTRELSMPSTLSSPFSLTLCYSSGSGCCCALLIIVPNQLPQSLFLHKIQLHFFRASFLPSYPHSFGDCSMVPCDIKRNSGADRPNISTFGGVLR